MPVPSGNSDDLQNISNRQNKIVNFIDYLSQFKCKQQNEYMYTITMKILQIFNMMEREDWEKFKKQSCKDQVIKQFEKLVEQHLNCYGGNSAIDNKGFKNNKTNIMKALVDKFNFLNSHEKSDNDFTIQLKNDNDEKNKIIDLSIEIPQYTKLLKKIYEFCYSGKLVQMVIKCQAISLHWKGQQYKKQNFIYHQFYDNTITKIRSNKQKNAFQRQTSEESKMLIQPFQNPPQINQIQEQQLQPSHSSLFDQIKTNKFIIQEYEQLEQEPQKPVSDENDQEYQDNQPIRSNICSHSCIYSKDDKVAVQLHSVIRDSSVQNTSNQYEKSVGLLQSVWKNNHSQESVSFSTGFAISPSIIITCAHGIYDSKKKRHCDEVNFVPVNGVSKSAHIYKTKKYNFLRFIHIRKEQSYKFRPLAQDFAVLILDKPLPNKIFFKLATSIPNAGDKLKIWGYPSQNYKIGTPIEGTSFKRSDLQGICIGISPKMRHIIVHDLLTEVGHSGSPILKQVKKDEHQQLQVVGIHTHKGLEPQTYEGLAMTDQLREQIIGFARELLRDHGLTDQQSDFQNLYYYQQNAERYDFY